jgi:hypothetical protein
MPSRTREAFRLKRNTLLGRVRTDYGCAEGLDDLGEGGLAGALQWRVGDAVDCGAVIGPENTEVQTYAVGDSLVVCVREKTIPLGTQVRQVATFSIETRHLVPDAGGYKASREGVEAVLKHASDLLPALRALQTTGL